MMCALSEGSLLHLLQPQEALYGLGLRYLVTRCDQKSSCQEVSWSGPSGARGHEHVADVSTSCRIVSRFSGVPT